MAISKTKSKIQIEIVNGTKPDIVISPERANKVIEYLKRARISMLLHTPFFGTMACHLKLVAADNWIDTAATDGRHFYYNHDFIEKLSPEERVFLFAHEVLHNVYGHTGELNRTGDRDRRLANIAQDYVINLDLVNAKVGTFPTSVPGLLDHKYAGLSSEEVYDLLFQEREKNKQSGGKGGMSDGDLDKLLDKLLDKHLEPGEGEDAGDKENDGTGKNGPIPMTAEERAGLRDEIREALLNAAQTAKAGSLPLGVQRIVGQLTEPKMNWKQILNQHLESLVLHDHSWMRTSRIGWDIDAILPGMLPGTEVNCVVAIDMSGSISAEQARTFLSEVKGIMDQFDEYKIHVFTYDTQVYNHKIFSNDGFEDIMTYEPKGGGGTDFNVIYDFIREQKIECPQVLNFTDMYPNSGWGVPDDPDKVIHVAHGTKTIQAPFGVTVYFDETA
jgi:predicted metal-dependent peptidase